MFCSVNWAVCDCSLGGVGLTITRRTKIKQTQNDFTKEHACFGTTKSYSADCALKCSGMTWRVLNQENLKLLIFEVNLFAVLVKTYSSLPCKSHKQLEECTDQLIIALINDLFAVIRGCTKFSGSFSFFFFFFPPSGLHVWMGKKVQYQSSMQKVLQLSRTANL